jgi:tetratricopeptide (TPR) repeat protein
MLRRALNAVAASMPLLALASPLAVAEGALRYHVPYVCNGERIVVTRCRSDSDQPGFPATQPGSDYCAVVYPDRPLRNGLAVETAELRAAVLNKLGSCNGATPAPSPTPTPTPSPTPSPAPSPPEALPATSSDLARAKMLTDQGVQYFNAKEYTKAASILQTALRLAPDNADAARYLGVALIDLKQYADGRDVLQRAVRLKPDDVGAQYWLGYANVVLRAFPSAAVALKEALRVQPDNVDALHLLGTTYVGMRNRQAALQVYQKLQTLNKEEARELYQLINEVQPDAQSPPAAQTPPNAPAPGAADDTRARDLLAQGDKYRKSGAYAKAVAAYNQVLALVPPRSDQAADAHYGLGTMALDQKDYRRAIPDLLIAQRLRPTDPEIQVELGDALMMVDTVPQAIPHFQEAIRLQPDFVYAYQLLSMAYWLSNDKENALRVCQKLKPLDAQASADCYQEVKEKPP